MGRVRRGALVPWRAAGVRSDSGMSADEVVRTTGWVFNNRTGRSLTLGEFVRTGDHEARWYLREFGLDADRLGDSDLLEIGSGIGRMTAALSNACRTVVAADLDAAFLERCRETVARHGRPERLQTVHVADGRTIALPDASVDVVFSYITLQHCSREDALSLVAEAMRVVRPGGVVALDFRTWMPIDAILVPLGALVRAAWRSPVIGRWIATRRFATRLGWQANRLTPNEVLDALYADPGLRARLGRVRVLHSHRRVRTVDREGVEVRPLRRTNRSHWWLVVDVASSERN